MADDVVKVLVNNGNQLTFFAFLVAFAVLLTEFIYGGVPQLIYNVSLVYFVLVLVIAILGASWKVLR